MVGPPQLSTCFPQANHGEAGLFMLLPGLCRNKPLFNGLGVMMKAPRRVGSMPKKGRHPDCFQQSRNRAVFVMQ